MQAYGGAPTDSATAPAGIQVAASESGSDYLTQFTGYIEGADAGAGAAPSAAFADLAKNRAQLVHTVQASAAFAVDPSATAAQSSIAVQAVSPNSTVLRSLLADGIVGDQADGDQLTPGLAEAYSLAVNYYTATPTALSSADLKALQSVAPADFASLSATQVSSDPAATASTPSTISLNPSVGPQLSTGQNNTALGQFLPTSDLKLIFSEPPTLPASALNSEQALFSGTTVGASTPANHAALPASSVPQGTGGPLADIIIPATTAQTAGLPSADAPLFPATGAAQQAATPDAKSMAYEGGDAVSRSIAANASHAQQQNIDSELDADGQILAVNQKAQNANNGQGTPARASQIAQALAQNQAQNQTQTNAQTPAETQASALTASTQPAAESTTIREPFNAANKLADDSTPTKTATIQPALAAATMTRGGTDWTSPWITPERAAGWPDGFATSLISTGLGGLMGANSGLSSMGLMGGQPNATMGGHVTKQLNLNLTRAVKAGEQEFSMRMDPPELGRVSVKLRFGQNGLVKSQIMAERPETLELLQREVRGLERAIEAGGHKSEQGSISFSLDSDGQESAGKAFAEAMQQDRLKEEIEGRSAGHDGAFADGDMEEVEIDLDEVLAHVTPETGLDVRV